MVYSMVFYVISIHALVKRATDYDEKLKAVEEISIHALVKRATTGSDFKTTGDIISIHALVKRATLAYLGCKIRW